MAPPGGAFSLVFDWARRQGRVAAVSHLTSRGHCRQVGGAQIGGWVTIFLNPEKTGDCAALKSSLFFPTTWIPLSAIQKVLLSRP
jgi:hypothetical protein